MTKEQAVKLLSEAVSQLRLTLKEHALLQEALKVLANEEPKTSGQVQPN